MSNHSMRSELASMAARMKSMAAEMNQAASGRLNDAVSAPPGDSAEYEITSIKYLAGELTLRVVGDGEVSQQLEAGQIVTLRKSAP